MTKEYTNDDVYEFLAEECRYDEFLWKEYGEGILSRTTDRDFWDSLADHLDCLRVCDECGKPMVEGFLIETGEHYCSEECLLKHTTWEHYLELYADGDGDSFWTTWYEDSKTFTGWVKKGMNGGVGGWF